MNTNDSSRQERNPDSRHDGDQDVRSTSMNPFRLPHESQDGVPRATRPAARPVTGPVRTSGDPDHVLHVTQRRTSARRMVSGLSVGLVVAAGVGVGGLTWVAQQASAGTTTATAQTTTGTTSTDDNDDNGETVGQVATTTTGTTSSSGAVTVTATSGSANASTSAS